MLGCGILHAMNQSERDVGVGRLARQYAENEQCLAILISRCDDLGDKLIRVGEGLKARPERVQLPVMEDIQVGGESLNDTLERLRKAQADKAKLEKCLDQAGLSGLVRN
jgi:hypothetical protein